MFLAATARPRFDAEGNCSFDGKVVRILPFTTVRLAVRNSVNGPAGTPLVENENCTKETYKKKLIENVIPTIHEKFLTDRWDANRPARIPQDNATPHKVLNDAELAPTLSSEADKPTNFVFSVVTES